VLELLKMQGVYSPESMDFQAKLLERSGVGDATHWPPSIVQMIRPELALQHDADGKPIIPTQCDRSNKCACVPGQGRWRQGRRRQSRESTRPQTAPV
jgi:hypothetical protein